MCHELKRERGERERGRERGEREEREGGTERERKRNSDYASSTCILLPVKEKLSVDRDSEISATCLKLSMICPVSYT